MSSYVLDRDTLLATLCSSRIATAPAQPSPPAPVATNCIGASHWIDVNSNAALIGSYHRTANCNDAEVKKQITEVKWLIRNICFNLIFFFRKLNWIVFLFLALRPIESFKERSGSQG